MIKNKLFFNLCLDTNRYFLKLYMDYLKIGKATDLTGKERKIYRFLEMLPAFLSWVTILGLIILSYFFPIQVAYFMIAFDVYWLLLVLFLGIYLLSAYGKMNKNKKMDWEAKCVEIEKDFGKFDEQEKIYNEKKNIPLKYKFKWTDLYNLVVLPTYNEGMEIIKPTIEAIIHDSFPKDKMIIVYAVEERGGEEALERAKQIEKEYGHLFRNFIISVHPDGIEGELKGKGANQAWAAQVVREELIDKEKLDYEKILVSVFDIDTIIYPGYFHNLVYTFLTVENAYRASYQPVPVYHNNIWQAPFFARMAASSNTFWQMMQQIRQEKLATYSSHSMPWIPLVDIGFWSTKMVSEDSRIFWHCFCYYKGDYRVEPMNFPVSMDVCMGKSGFDTAKNLYKQQRRWGWGVENVPYLIFNTMKNWKNIPRGKFVGRILVQVYGFHSWGTNAIIIAVVGWMPLILGGDRFNSTVLSGNLPVVTRTLMTLAMGGLVLSAILSTMSLPKKPKEVKFRKYFSMIGQWILLPFGIIIFGAVPGLEAQTRLMFGKYMGFWVTPKSR